MDYLYTLMYIPQLNTHVMIDSKYALVRRILVYSRLRPS